MGIAFEVAFAFLVLILVAIAILAVCCWPLIDAMVMRCKQWMERDRRIIRAMKDKDEVQQVEQRLRKEAEAEVEREFRQR